MEERRIAVRLLVAHLVVAARSRGAEREGEQAARPLDDVHDPLGRERVGYRRGDDPRDLVHPGIHGGIRGAECGEPGRHGERIAAERSGLVHRPERGESVHDLGATAERREREPSADDLAERDEVGHVVFPLEPPPSAGADPEAGQHLVEDEQGAVLARQAATGRR